MTLLIQSIISNLKMIVFNSIIVIISGNRRNLPFTFIKSQGLKQKSFVLNRFGLMTDNLRSDSGKIDKMDHSKRARTGLSITTMKLKSTTQMILAQVLEIYRDYLSNRLFLRNFLVIRKAIYSLV